MLAFRFANGMFEPLWNRNYIDHVQITAAEDIGIGSRAGYYDRAGALRDLVQNHMLQLLHAAVHGAAGATSPPTRSATRRSRSCARSSAPTPEDVDRDGGPRAVRARARSAARRCRATSRRTACPQDSNTETYAALRLEVDNWRWAGVPFYLRTGKRLARKVTEIAVTLKPVPHLALQQDGVARRASPTSSSSPCSPTRACRCRSGRRSPGTRMRDPPGEHGVPLRHGVPVAVAGGLRAADPRRDARRRDALHPQRRGRGAVADHATRSCSAWEATPGPLPQYAAGAQGPAEADALLVGDDRWRAI